MENRPSYNHILELKRLFDQAVRLRHTAIALAFSELINRHARKAQAG